MRVLFKIVLFFVAISSVQAQSEDIRFEDYAYSEDIKSIKFTLRGYPLSLPIIVLNSGEKLQLAFDDLSHDDSDFIYELIHCDKDWNRSTLMETDFIRGFNGQRIWDSEYSSVSYSNYISYTLDLPNDDISWLISGNYILAVYDEDAQEPIITRRFVVVEGDLSIEWNMRKPRDVMEMNYKHAFDFNLKDLDATISRPMLDTYAAVFQNGQWCNQTMNIKPDYVKNGRVYFCTFNRTQFPALKEFRNFDARSIQFRKFGVHAIERHSTGTDVLLELGTIRNNKNFFFDNDADGGFITANQDFQARSRFGEYVKVIFTLETETPFDEDIYVTGGFTDWQPYEEYKMEYDPQRSIYICEAMMKQGYYDYMYGIYRDDKLDLETVEGSWFETENLYSILIYYRPPNSQYDRVIASTTFEASSNSNFSIDQKR